MKIFYSAIDANFYFSNIHGDFTEMVLTPDWVRPTKKIVDPDWIAPEDEPDATPLMIDVPDEDAQCPEIEQRNMRIPDDAVVVTESDYVALMQAQENGMRIVANESGYPVAVTQPDDVIVDRVRAERDRRISLVLPILDRHRNQKEYNIATTLTDEDAAIFARYLQDLRDISDGDGFPHNIDWPAYPE